MIALLLLMLSFGSSGAQADEAALRKQAAGAMRAGRFDEALRLYRDLIAARPADAEPRIMLGDAYLALGRSVDAAAELRHATGIAPTLPTAWYALGHAYNAIKREAASGFGDRPEDAPWQQLLAADTLLANGRLIDAFLLYRQTLGRLPAMPSIHDAIAVIYERSGHADWAKRERAKVVPSRIDCTSRRAMCEFRAGRHDAALARALENTDAESRYWRVRAANELALSAFKRVEALPDSVERRAVRATLARQQERYADAVAELTAALALRPGDPALLYELASMYYAARDYDRALATLEPLLNTRPDDARLLELAGFSLLQLRRPEEAIAYLRRAVDRNPAAPGPRVALGRAYAQAGKYGEAIPLLESALASDQDGSLHVQLARSYGGTGEKQKAQAVLTRSQELRRAADERDRAAAQRTITPP